MLFQVTGNGQCIFRMADHPQMQCFQALQEEKGVKRRQGGSQIPKQRHPRLDNISNVSRRLQGFHEVNPVVTGIGIGDKGKFTIGPVKLS